MTNKSGCEIFVSDMISGEDVFSTHVMSVVPKKVRVSFDIGAVGDYYVGIRNDSEDPDGFAIIDYCNFI